MSHSDQSSSGRGQTYCVRVVGSILIEAKDRDDAIRRGRLALNGETDTGPDIELDTTDAWTYQGGRRS